MPRRRIPRLWHLLPLLLLLPLPSCDLDPLSPGTPLAAASIAAGSFHVCRLGDDGALFCWGTNTFGQLGDGTQANRERPVRSAEGLRFESVIAGAFHTCGLTEASVLHCWGGNPAGVLGTLGTFFRTTPSPTVPEFALYSIVLGSSHNCGLDANGAAFCWGDNGLGQLGIHDLMTTCGGGTCSPDPIAVAGGIRFAELSTFADHTCGITNDGAAYCWGANGSGQLGNGTFTRATAPVLVAGDLRFRSVHAGGSHTCGITVNNQTFCWGLGASGQLGSDDRGDGPACCVNRPLRTHTELEFVTIAAGDLHTCALTTRGDAYCWGQNNFGQLGNGAIFQERQPARVNGRQRFRTLAAGNGLTCGVNLDGETYCWGDNFRFQLGNGGFGIRSTEPARVEIPGIP